MLTVGLQALVSIIARVERFSSDWCTMVRHWLWGPGQSGVDSIPFTVPDPFWETQRTTGWSGIVPKLTVVLQALVSNLVRVESAASDWCTVVRHWL